MKTESTIQKRSFENESNRPASSRTAGGRTLDLPMLMVIGYLMVEYLRPSYISALRPALVLQVLFVIYIFLRKEKASAVFRDTYFKLFIALMALMTLHVFIALNNFWALMQWEVMVAYLLASIGICMFIDTPERLKMAVSAFIFFHAICAVNRLVGFPLNVGTTGPLGDTNDFALAMNVVLPVSFFVGLHHRGKKRLLYWSFCILFVAANVNCSSRGGFIGLAAVALIIVGSSRYKIKAAVIFIMVIAIFWALVPPTFKKEMGTIQEEGADTGTGQERVELWKVAWRGFLDNPVLGVGQGNMPLLMPKYQYDRNGKSFFQREIWFRSIHSVYFTALPELGSVGFGIWIWMLINIYRKSRAMKAVGIRRSINEADTSELEQRDYIRQVGFGLIVGAFGYLVTGIFLSAFYYPNLWTLSAMITAGHFIGKKLEEQSMEQIASNES